MKDKEVRVIELIKQTERHIFNIEAVKPGRMIYARHKSWEEGSGGYISAVGEDEIVVQCYAGLRNTASHFKILSEEVAKEQWEIRWSHDLKQIEELKITEQNLEVT